MDVDMDASDPASVALSSSGIVVVVVLMVDVVDVLSSRDAGDPRFAARSRSIAAARSRAALGAAGKNCAKPAPDAGGIAVGEGQGRAGRRRDQMRM